MMIEWNNCDACIHGEICGRKAEYDRLKEKIQNIDKNKTYEGFIMKAECSHFRVMTGGIRGEGGINCVVRA